MLHPSPLLLPLLLPLRVPWPRSELDPPCWLPGGGSACRLLVVLMVLKLELLLRLLQLSLLLLPRVARPLALRFAEELDFGGGSACRARRSGPGVSVPGLVIGKGAAA